MIKIFIFLIAFSFSGFSQTKNGATNSDAGFVITGNVTGFANGTSVSFLNEQTNAPEKQATIENGRFVIKGHMEEPGFKGLIFGDQPPLVPLFLDNSNIKITGDKNALDKLSITGSPAQA